MFSEKATFLDSTSLHNSRKIGSKQESILVKISQFDVTLLQLAFWIPSTNLRNNKKTNWRFNQGKNRVKSWEKKEVNSFFGPNDWPCRSNQDKYACLAGHRPVSSLLVWSSPFQLLGKDNSINVRIRNDPFKKNTHKGLGSYMASGLGGGAEKE